jgi:hypothetical protein
MKNGNSKGILALWAESGPWPQLARASSLWHMVGHKAEWAGVPWPGPGPKTREVIVGLTSGFGSTVVVSSCGSVAFGPGLTETVLFLNYSKKINCLELIRAKDGLPEFENFQIKYVFVGN